MVRFDRSAVINVPIERVFDYMAEPNNFPEWDESIVENKDRTEGPVRVGTSWTQVYRIMGKNLEIRRTVTEYERPHKIVWEAAMRGTKTSGACTFESTGGGTKMILETELNLPGWFLGQFVDTLLLERYLNRLVAHNIATIKALLESGQAGS
jgi:uncharacterized membrane protein